MSEINELWKVIREWGLFKNPRLNWEDGWWCLSFDKQTEPGRGSIALGQTISLSIRWIKCHIDWDKAKKASIKAGKAQQGEQK
jgi:hypothetical protein